MHKLVLIFLLTTATSCMIVEGGQGTPIKVDALAGNDLLSDTHLSDASVPDTHRPQPDSISPDTLRPDTLSPDILSPDTLSPDTLRPDTLSPDILRPDTLSPDTLSPDILQPDTLSPDTLSPDTLSLDMGVIASIKWITVRAGWYERGRPTTAVCPKGRGTVRTYVKKFKMMKYEMTQQQMRLLTRKGPWTYCVGGDHECPAGGIKRLWALRACNALSDREGLARCYTGDCDTRWNCHFVSDLSKCGYRLPTPEEFEYAYRAGTTTEFYNGAASPTMCEGPTKALTIAWYEHNSENRAHPIGQKLPNAWGFYDLAGNVMEWLHFECPRPQDDAAGGGGFSSPSSKVQAGAWGYYWSIYAPNERGLRCVRSL